MSDELRARLEATHGTVRGSDLAAHLRRDGVLFCDAELDLVTCGLAIATDDAAAVADWLQRGLLMRPTPAQREAWLATPERPWRAVVVQPFVLIQALD